MNTEELKLRADEYRKGWSDCESFIEQMALTGDPGFQRWLDTLNEKSRKAREQKEELLGAALNEQQNHEAAQAADDYPNF